MSLDPRFVNLRLFQHTFWNAPRATFTNRAILGDSGIHGVAGGLPGAISVCVANFVGVK